MSEAAQVVQSLVSWGYVLVSLVSWYILTVVLARALLLVGVKPLEAARKAPWIALAVIAALCIGAGSYTHDRALAAMVGIVTVLVVLALLAVLTRDEPALSASAEP